MNTPFLLSLPRLHAELLPHIADCRTLWPGLPSPPASAWVPAMPLSPAMAAACLTDYERACRDGASGGPVLTLGAAPAPADLSEAEMRALREMAGLPSETPEPPLRQQAQQILLLTWLQEKQALEMTALTDKIRNSRRTLTGLISGVARTDTSPSAPDERDLPDWQHTLGAALAFLPDMPDDTVILVSAPAMAAAIEELDAAKENTVPDGYHTVRLPVSDLAALCGRLCADRLKHGLSADQWQRTLTLCLPDTSI